MFLMIIMIIIVKILTIIVVIIVIIVMRVIIHGFHVTSEKKTNIKYFKLLPSSGESHFKRNIYLLACLQLGRPLCFENRTRFFSQCVTSALFLDNMLRARKYRLPLCFRVLSNQFNMLREVPMRMFSSLTERINAVREPK